jgi:predicted nucleic acid-binding protein
VIQEILQGIREESATESFRDALLSIPRLSDPLPLNTFLEAAEIYRHGRRRGYTIRSAADCLIAVIAIENKVPVWHKDRDFRLIASFTNLRTIEGLPPVRQPN